MGFMEAGGWLAGLYALTSSLQRGQRPAVLSLNRRTPERCEPHGLCVHVGANTRYIHANSVYTLYLYRDVWVVAYTRLQCLYYVSPRVNVCLWVVGGRRKGKKGIAKKTIKERNRENEKTLKEMKKNANDAMSH